MRTYQSKIQNREAIPSLLANFPQKSIGFTSGTFDLLHFGHLSYLQETKNFCQILIVGINSDASVKNYKNPSRPILPEQERLALIAGLECVDYTFLFSETNNHQNIQILKPHWYFKAGDYQPEQLTSKPLVEQYGGQVQIIPFVANHSTTALIRKIQSISSPL